MSEFGGLLGIPDIVRVDAVLLHQVIQQLLIKLLLFALELQARLRGSQAVLRPT